MIEHETDSEFASAPDAPKCDDGENAPDTQDSSLLDRTMGLPSALAIGVGTMVGAGIFVFPGLVAEQQGASGVFAFLIAGTLALIVAFYTAELATALPVSGGSYSIIEKALGTWPGRVVGLAQWAGLVFASAFYLSAFSDYAVHILKRFGLGGASLASHAGPVAAIVLTGVVARSGRRAGGLQAGIVLLLTMALMLIFLLGLWQIFGESGSQVQPQEFLPKDSLSLMSTAAMIFTAYIGFVQIAAVAGEIRRPGRNLPIGLVGSVLIVLMLYLLVYFVSVALLGPEDVDRAGETAVVDAGALIAGALGSAVVLGAGLLATLSSANASILSASRTLFGLARDDYLPAIIQRTGMSSNSPWVAVVVTGLPCAGLAYFSLSLLAELASLIHLLIYGLICVAIWPARRNHPDWFKPKFQVPGHSGFAVATGLICFALIGFMSSVAQLSSLLVISVCAVLLFAYSELVRNSSRQR